jgi:hypothetical protein
MAVYEGVSKVKKLTCKDSVGLIKALLDDLPNEGQGLEYDEWLNLVSLIKYEVEDEELGFQLFDEFSQKADIYDPDFTYTKFFDAQFEGTGEVTLGTLVFWAKRDLGTGYSQEKYAKFYSDEAVAATKVLRDKIRVSKNKLPDHILTEEVEALTFPKDVRVEPQLALFNILIKGEHYATAEHPAREHMVDPYAGDTLHQYITVNPIKKGTKRLQANVTQFKYSVVEFDSISLDEQWSALSAVDLPYEALIYTGGKSIHAWIRIDAPDLETYKKRTRLIGKMFEDFGYTKKNGNKVDTAVLYDCASWVRTAGVKRTAIKDGDEHTNGVEQKVIWTEPSEGWDHWYDNVYPKYVVESSLQEEEEAPAEFEVPVKTHNFNRIRKSMERAFGEDFTAELVEAFKNVAEDGIEEFLDEAVNGFFQAVRKKAKLSLSLSDLYHLHEAAVMEGGCLYVGDIREALLNSCYIAQKFEENRKAEAVKRLEEFLDFNMDLYKEYVDLKLLDRINSTLETKMEGKEEDYEKVLASVNRMFKEFEFRSVVLQESEIHRYAENAGKCAVDALSGKRDAEHGAVYKFRDSLSFFSKHKELMEEINVPRYHSIIAPYLAFVKQKTSGEFNVVSLDNDSTVKMINSYQFLDCFRNVEFLSDVPIFNPTEGELIFGYNKDFEVLVTGDSKGYGIMELEAAKKILNDLFVDFKFVSPSDHSRAMACLLMPALCHAGMLNDDSRPIVYIDADSQGAGKGTVIKFLVYPYTEKSPFVTQDDSSIGSIDEKIGVTIMDGHNHVILDNLKPTRKMKEFSSPFVEGMLTTNNIQFRSAGMQRTTLDVSNAVVYVTTNGMPLSRDLAERSLYVSIRKQPSDYKHKFYAGGLEKYLIENRPRIMSAIYTVLKEYVDRGSPTKKPLEGHRFLYSVPILNYIVTEIMGMEDITLGLNKKNSQKSDTAVDVARAICFATEQCNMLGSPLNNLDIFEVLDQTNTTEILDLDYNLEVWADEACTNITPDAKRAIGMKISRVMSRPSLLGKSDKKRTEVSCQVEEFTLTRTYNSHTQQPVYTVTKE